MSKQLLLPKPSGFRVLLKARQVEEKTKGGIILTDDSREAAKFSCVVSEVISMGSDCYHDKNESWCKVGDWVLTAKYVGLKFKYEGEEYSMINDDEVLAVVPDPSKISHK